MTCILPVVDEQLSHDQAGFIPGSSCYGQVLNLTQLIEDGFENQLKTGAVLVDLTATFETVSHKALLVKVVAPHEDHAALHGIFQFPDVSGPRVVQQYIHTAGGNA